MTCWSNPEFWSLFCSAVSLALCVAFSALSTAEFAILLPESTHCSVLAYFYRSSKEKYIYFLYMKLESNKNDTNINN